MIRVIKLGIYFIALLLFYTECTVDNVPQPATETWIVTTITGNGEGFLDGELYDAKFNTPIGLALSANNELYIADNYNNSVRKIGLDRWVDTFAGMGVEGLRDGYVDTALFDHPFGIVIAANGTIFITDRERAKIRKISNGIVSTLAGGIGGNADGTGSEAGFSSPSGITIGIDGNLYVADQNNNSIRKVTPEGVVTTFAGSKATSSGYRDGYRTEALFQHPIDICVSQDGNFYIVEDDGRRIRKINPDGIVSTVKIVNNMLYFPKGIAIAPDGTLYVADENCIRRILVTGEIETIAGTRDRGNADGDQARFWGVTDVIVAPDGSLRVSDSYNNRICKVEIKR